MTGGIIVTGGITVTGGTMAMGRLELSTSARPSPMTAAPLPRFSSVLVLVVVVVMFGRRLVIAEKSIGWRKLE